MDCLKEIMVVLSISFVAGDIKVYPSTGPLELKADFEDLPADFGSLLPTSGLSVLAVYANPANACAPIDGPPLVESAVKLWAVLIQRYDCKYEDKILHAQRAGFHVAIVHNVNSSELVKMGVDHPELIDIPSLFVGATTGKAINNSYLYDKGFWLRIDDPTRDFDFRLMIPSIVVIILSVVAMIGFMISKWINYRRRNRRRRLPCSSLAQIPTAKYRKGDPYETCAICLDDFTEGEKLRVLPCSHAYHCNCIDPWLTRNRRVCPMCKRKVFAQDERIDTDDSVSDDDDNAPLLRRSYSDSNLANEATRGAAFEILNRIIILTSPDVGVSPPGSHDDSSHVGVSPPGSHDDSSHVGVSPPGSHDDSSASSSSISTS